ncbi:MAG: transglycosylase domain-containing protein [Clostridia bacterium]|nr:transglycosylase domain-containing protein [Clostridia bacterium]
MKKAAKVLLVISLVLVLGGIISGIAIVASVNATLDVDKLTPQKNNIVLLDSADNVILDSSFTPLSEISDHLKNAFIAVEDKRFYHHNGLDGKRIVGALIRDLKNKNFSEGASTITCQLAKNTQLSSEKTLLRKLKEAKLALKLEKNFTKDEILEAYLNVIYFGNGIYGVGEAANRFFGKRPNELTISESASIAATVVNPSAYSPLLNPENNLSRRNMVLRLMREQGYIDEEEEERSKSDVIATKPKSKTDDYSFFATKEAKEILKNNNITYSGKVVVKTYCVQAEQEMAEEALTCETDQSVLVLSSGTGGIVAYSSTHDYSPLTLRRPIGSTIKPFIYAKTFESGKLLPVSILKDEKTDFNGYSPSNFGDVYRGNISVRESIAYSSNVCAVQATSILGLNDAVSFLRTVGFDILPSEENLTLSLGATEQTMATLASAYGVFSSGLVRHATFIKEIKDENGNVLYSNDESGKTALHSDSIAYINDCLKACSEYGTAKKLKDLLYAKTGSVGGSNGNSDVWCVGYDDERVYCAWAGNLSMEKDKMLSQTGGGLTAEIVKNAYTDVGQPARIYAKKGYIDSLSLSRDGVIRLADENTPERYKIYDYVGNIKEVTSYFSSPEARFESAIEGNVLTLNCEPYKENIYQIAVVSTGGFFAKAYSYEELQEPLVFNLPNGFTIVTVTAYSKGVRLSKGEEVIKRYWV